MRIKLGIPLTLKEICDFTGGRCLSGTDTVITHISTDTRQLSCGDLFIAISGKYFDGEDFLEEASARGAYTLGCSKHSSVMVKSTSEALLMLAKEYRYKLCGTKLLAITGSVGKTTTKELLYSIASGKYKTHATDGNYNNEIGTPLTLLSAPKDTELIVLEMGMNNFGELSRLSRCCSPDCALITNIGTAHIGNFGSREMIAKAKLEILEGAASDATVIIPYGEPLLARIANPKTFSSEYPAADYYLRKTDENANNFTYYSKKSGTFRINTALMGNHIKDCLCASLAACEELGMCREEILDGIKRLPSSLSRGALLNIGKTVIFDDSYNSSAESVISSLKTLSSLPYSKKSALLGDMQELGALTEQLHRKIGAACFDFGIDKLYTFGVYSEFIASGAIDAGFDKNKIFKNSDPTNPYETARQIYSSAEENEVILFKASHSLRLHRITEALKSLL